VTDVAREQASGVAAEAGRQGRELLQQAQGQMEEQAARGQRWAAERLLSLSDELRSMADNSGQGGVAADVAQQAAAPPTDERRTNDQGLSAGAGDQAFDLLLRE